MNDLQENKLTRLRTVAAVTPTGNALRAGNGWNPDGTLDKSSEPSGFTRAMLLRVKPVVRLEVADRDDLSVALLDQACGARSSPVPGKNVESLEPSAFAQAIELRATESYSVKLPPRTRTSISNSRANSARVIRR